MGRPVSGRRGRRPPRPRIPCSPVSRYSRARRCAGGFRGEGGEGFLCCTGGHQGASASRRAASSRAPPGVHSRPGGPRTQPRRKQPPCGCLPRRWHGTWSAPPPARPRRRAKVSSREEAGGSLADGDRLMPIWGAGQWCCQEGEQVHILWLPLFVPVLARTWVVHLVTSKAPRHPVRPGASRSCRSKEAR